MPLELQWLARYSTAAWYWLDANSRQSSCPELPNSGSLNSACAEWQRFLAGQGIAWPLLSEALLPLSAEFDSPTALARALLPRMMTRDRAKSSEPNWIHALRSWELAYATSQPKIVEELQLRIGPIRELAESYLPGLLRMVERQGNPLLVPERARVVVVPTIRAGYSRSFR
jgi:hypothetical protein